MTTPALARFLRARRDATAQGRAPEHPRIRSLVDGLLGASPEFARLWEHDQARGKRTEVKDFVHPLVGELTLRVHTFDVAQTPGQQPLCNQAEPASRSTEALAPLLKDLEAERRPASERSHADVRVRR